MSVGQTVEIKWIVENVGADGARTITRTVIYPHGFADELHRQTTYMGSGWVNSTEDDFQLDVVGTYTFIIDTVDDHYMHRITVTE